MGERSEAAQRLGPAIHAARTGAGMSQRELAELAGIGFPYVSKIENGLEVPSTAVVCRIAEALEVDPFFLINDPDLAAARSWLNWSQQSSDRDHEAERVVSVLVERLINAGAWR